MRETTYDVNTDELIEMTVEYCHAILDARSEEELATIKEQIADEIRTNTDYPEEYIQNYMTSLNNAVEKLESGEVTLAEDGEFVRSDENIQEGQEVPVVFEEVFEEEIRQKVNFIVLYICLLSAVCSCLLLF